MIFARLPASTRPGDKITFPEWRGTWIVDTAKLADDGRDTKCTLILESEVER